MLVTDQKKELSERISAFRKAGKKVGLVPTMGALHTGHLSLVEKADSQCGLVIVSIFVNPTQFDNPEDLKKYPRSLEKDRAFLEKKFPKAIVFAPSAETVYEGKVVSQHFDFGPLENEMEGKYRSGHFDGVGTVLKLLFDIVRPDKAYFGEKDFQQLQIVRKLVQITGQAVDITACPIARETNGLARSSRNERLTMEQRQEAGFIFKTLQQAKTFFGTKSVTFIADWVRDQFDQNQHFKLEYFQIAETETLKPIDQKKQGRFYRAFIAAYAGKVRLIDNIALH